ncbi:MAG: cytidine deaminase [Thermoplasmata archaeon]|nr:MAG: cytidine deaminase [Thermoplasmata archaeon]
MKEFAEDDCYFMAIAKSVARRSTCTRREVGAVIVRDGKILSTGYNGPPQGIRHCDIVGCLREELGIKSGEHHELCRGIHAEQNAIVNAARFGISIYGSKIYITTFPCSLCAKMIVNSGIREVIYLEEYADNFSAQILRDGGIIVRKLSVDECDYAEDCTNGASY